MSLLDKWPLLRQLKTSTDGTGMEAASPQTKSLRARTYDTQTARSVCPYCGVGCGQLIRHRRNELIAIEGDPQSPINQGTLRPKGSASHQLLTQPDRLKTVLYRPPYGRGWQKIGLDTAMDMIAERVLDTQRRTYRADENGRRVGHTTAMAHLGGATLDNEENYLIRKLFTAGLGMVCVSNQARI